MDRAASCYHVVVRSIAVAILSFSTLTIAGCVPSMARSNARIDPGFNVALAGGAQFVGEGERGDGSSSSFDTVLHLEVDVEWAQKFEDDSGFAVQFKVPLNFVFMSLDLYYALPAQGQTNLGFGAEIGALPGLYGAITRYMSKDTFITFTPRVLLHGSDVDGGVLLNPQLTVGIDGGLDIYAFANFAHHTGRGFDFDIDLFSDEDNKDYRKNFGLAGLAIRF